MSTPSLSGGMGNTLFLAFQARTCAFVMGRLMLPGSRVEAWRPLDSDWLKGGSVNEVLTLPLNEVLTLPCLATSRRKAARGGAEHACVIRPPVFLLPDFSSSACSLCI